MAEEKIYLDHNATTPVDAEVLEEMLPYFSTHFGNAASRTHSFGWIAEDAVKTARAQVAQLINCTEQEIIFTSGATEAINLAVKGVWENYSKNKGNHIVTIQTEHKAVLDTCKSLEKKGARVTHLPVDREGKIDLKQLEDAITEETILVCAMFANNETGLIHPVKKIAEIVHSKKSIFFCDATQAVGKMQIDITDGMDLLCMSAHKFYGPKGIGALYVRRKDPRVSLVAQMDGGGHERGLRSGTLNVPGIVGLGKACELSQKQMWDNSEKLSKLRTHLEQHLLDLGNVYINGSVRDRLPHVCNLSFAGIKADELITKITNIAVATGSACTSAIPEPSHVLKAMGLADELAYGSIRFSLGKMNTMEEMNMVIKKISEVITDLRR